MKFKIGGKIRYRPGFGKETPVIVEIEGIERCEVARSKYGVATTEATFEEKDFLVFSLSNGHWAYGEQVDEIIDEGESSERIKFTIYSDPGHAWAKVNIKFLKELGIDQEITEYSYKKGKYAYLEEDYDLGLLVKALEKEKIPYGFNEVFENDHSKIRSYERWK